MTGRLMTRLKRSLGFGRLIVVGVGLMLIVAGVAVAVGVGLQNPGFDAGLTGWSIAVDRPAGNGLPGDGQGKPNRQVVYGPGGSKDRVVPCEPRDRYGICLISRVDTFTTGTGITKTVEPRTGTHMLRLGGPYRNPFQNQHADHRFLAAQTFIVDPSMPDLKIRNKIFTYDTHPRHETARPGGRDRLEIEVLDASGDRIRHYTQATDDRGESKRLVNQPWTGTRINLAQYANQRVTLRVGLVGIADKLRGTWAYIDPALVSRPSRALTVALAGNGSGTVTGPGISCPPDCSQTYPVGASVSLGAAPSSGSSFAGFSGACGGSGCQLVMNRHQLVTAAFNRVAPPPPPPPAPAPAPAPAAPDTSGPTVKITGPSGKVAVSGDKKPRLRFKFKASESGATFDCKLDRGKLKACNSPYRTPKLKLGKHKLAVTATDVAGNTGSAARRSFKLVAARRK